MTETGTNAQIGLPENTGETTSSADLASHSTFFDQPTLDLGTLRMPSPGWEEILAQNGHPVEAGLPRLSAPMPNPDQVLRLEKGEYAEVTTELAAKLAKLTWAELGPAPALVEVRSLCIPTLGGMPGPTVPILTTAEFLEAICLRVHASDDLSATSICALAYYSGEGEPQVRIATLAGEILGSPRGQGESFDSIFVPDPNTQKALFGDSMGVRTLAELSPAERSKLSDRAQVLRVLKSAPFLAPARPRTVQASTALRELFIRDLKTQVDQGRYGQIEEIQEMLLAHRREQIDLMAKDPERSRQLIIEGELPVQTSYDLVKGALYYLDDGLMCRARTESFFDMERLTHPAVLETALAMQIRGHIPVREKCVPVMDRLITDGELNAFDDFALKPQEPEFESRIDERTAALHAGGLLTFTARGLVSWVTNGSSMYSVIGADSLATLGLCGSFGFAPADSIWSKVEARAQMIERAHRLVEESPIVQHHQYKDFQLSNGERLADFLVKRAKLLIGATLKPHPVEQAVKEAKYLYDRGVRLFRVYDAGSTTQLYRAISELRTIFGREIILLAGQVTGPNQANKLAELGADAIVVGIGDGEMCSTSTKADISGDNAKTAYQIIQAGIPIPVLLEGGVGNKMGVLLGLGAAGRMSSRGLIGGTIEQPPYVWFKLAGKLVKLYRGEAGPATKVSGGNTDYLGRPYNVEGIDGLVMFDSLSETPSLAYRLLLLNQALAKALRFQRLGSAEELQHMPKPPIYVLSRKASEAASPHHENGHAGSSPSALRRFMARLGTGLGIYDPDHANRLRI